MKRTQKAFTLIEIMVAIGCMMLVIGPIMRLFQQGTKSAMTGTRMSEASLEGQRIIRQIHDDLKMACFPWNGAGSYAFSDILLVDRSKAPFVSFGFNLFPQVGGIEDAVVSRKMSQSRAFRLSSQVVYKMDPPNRLIRMEKFHPDHPKAKAYKDGTQIHVLTERLNYLDLQPVEVQNPGGTNQWFIAVTVQLRDGYQRPDITSKPVQDGPVLPSMEKSSGRIVVDFFDIVYPEFFHAFANQEGMNRNWHTDVISE